MRTHRLAWVLWAATVSLVVGAIVLGLANWPEIPLFDAPLTIIPPTFATLVVGALSTGPFPEFPSASNPFGVEGAKPSDSVLAAGQPGGLACVIVTLLSLIVRFYFSRHIVAGNRKGDIRLLSKPGDTRFQVRLPM